MKDILIAAVLSQCLSGCTAVGVNLPNDRAITEAHREVVKAKMDYHTVKHIKNNPDRAIERSAGALYELIRKL